MFKDNKTIHNEPYSIKFVDPMKNNPYEKQWQELKVKAIEDNDMELLKKMAQAEVMAYEYQPCGYIRMNNRISQGTLHQVKEYFREKYKVPEQTDKWCEEHNVLTGDGYNNKESNHILKSVNRINMLIDKGTIKKIFVFDGWHGIFTKKVNELFGYKVDVIEIRNCLRIVEGLHFNKSDCIIFNENIIKDTGKAKDYILEQAKADGALIKILTEDIFM